jgi:NAD(P)-dependent dehydrogenase (short-subunit alcohol dehydrogenase family)
MTRWHPCACDRRGAHGGIGRATAGRLAAQGADVANCGLRRSDEDMPPARREAGWRGVESAVDQVRALGQRTIGINCDVTCADDIAAVFRTTSEALGTPTGVVNNSGVLSATRTTPIAEVGEAVWRRVIDVNLKGVC